jgi:SAM-dependent methyltransferase
MASMLRERLGELPGFRGLRAARDAVRLRSLRMRGDLSVRAQTRWRTATPDARLTWGIELSGEPFVSKVDSYGGFGADKAILEIGPGYGRLPKACCSLGVPFRRYVAVDLSQANVEYLRDTLTDPRIEVVCGDVQTLALNETFDTVMSSLTLKHLFPTFERALVNMAAHLTIGGRVYFDLIEGDRHRFEHDEVTFIRQYRRDEVVAILENAALELVAFDHVDHHPDHRRLLVVAAKRPAQGSVSRLAPRLTTK